MVLETNDPAWGGARKVETSLRPMIRVSHDQHAESADNSPDGYQPRPHHSALSPGTGRTFAIDSLIGLCRYQCQAVVLCQKEYCPRLAHWRHSHAQMTDMTETVHDGFENNSSSSAENLFANLLSNFFLLWKIPFGACIPIVEIIEL